MDTIRTHISEEHLKETLEGRTIVEVVRPSKWLLEILLDNGTLLEVEPEENYNQLFLEFTTETKDA